MGKQTLLDKAKKIKSRKPNNITDEEYELGVAWASGDITIKQISVAMEDMNISSVYVMLTKCFERYVQEDLKSNKRLVENKK